MNENPLYQAVLYLSRQCDGARTRDGAGWNKYDSEFGKLLSKMSFEIWSNQQKHSIWRAMSKYRKQLAEAGIDYEAIPIPIGSRARGSGGIRLKNNLIEIWFNYRADLVTDVKTIPGRRWNPDGKLWTVPASSAALSVAFARKHDFDVDEDLLAITDPDAVMADSEPITPIEDWTPIGRTITLETGWVAVRFDYNERVVESIKALQIAKWDKASKTWRVPYDADSLRKLWNWAPTYNFKGDFGGLEDRIRELVALKNQAIEASQAKDADIEIEGLGGELRPFQKAGVKYAIEKKRLIIADEMGLGKTVEALATIQGLNAFPALIVCPASLKLNWRKESLKWLPHLRGKIFILSGNATPDVLDSFRALVLLDNQERQYSLKQSQDVLTLRESPTPLGQSSQLPAHINSVNKATKGAKPVDQLPGSTPNANSPTSHISVWGADGSLTIDDSRNIGSIGNRGDTEKRASRSPASGGEHVPVAKDTPEIHLFNTERSANSGPRIPQDKPSVSLHSLIHSDLTAEPAFNFSSGTTRETSKSQLIAQAGPGNTEKDSSLALSGRPTLQVMRDSLKNSIVRQIGFDIFHSQLLIINYDIIDSWKYILIYLGLKSIVGDESHQLKSSVARRTLAFEEITNGCIYGRKGSKGNKADRKNKEVLGKAIPVRLLLSGTPLMNRPNELIAQLQIIDRLVEFGGWYKFNQRYCGYFADHWGSHNDGHGHLKELNELLRARCYVRRLKTEVLTELPPKIRTVMPVEISNRAQYDKAEADLIRWLLETKGKEKADAARRAEQLVRISELKQIAAKGKMAAIKEWVEDFLDSGEKLVLFGWHKSIVGDIARTFSCNQITGDTPLARRDEYVQDFQNDEACKLLACNIQAGGVGLTLTAASNVLFAELGWNDAQMDQAVSRCHRIGQKDSVTGWWFVGQGTIEEKIAELIEEKRQVVNAATDGIEPTEDVGIMNALIDRLVKPQVLELTGA